MAVTAAPTLSAARILATPNHSATSFPSVYPAKFALEIRNRFIWADEVLYSLPGPSFDLDLVHTFPNDIACDTPVPIDIDIVHHFSLSTISLV